METKFLLCCPLASSEHVCVESHGAVQADGVILSQVIILFFLLVFSYKLRLMRRVLYLQHVLVFKVNRQISNLLLKPSHLFLSLLLHMGKGA